MTDNPDQSQRFIDAARELGRDEDEGRWDATLKKVAAQKPAPGQPSTQE